MRTIIVSDIHGCAPQFARLLKKTGLRLGEDRLVLLGDLFDRGAWSYTVFRRILLLREKMGERLVLVRGNHDQFLLDYVRQGIGRRLWELNGGRRTLQSFAGHPGALEEAAELVTSMPLYYIGDQFIGVHAGLTNGGPETDEPETLLWDRSVIDGSYTGRLAVGGHTPLKAPVWFLPDHSLITLPAEKRFPLPDRGFIGIDTGCVGGGSLTALVIEGEEFYLQQIRKQL